VTIFMFVTGIVSVDDKELKINTEEGIPTVKMVNFFNDLFDSVNGDDKNDEHNELRCPVSEDSVHHAFWVSAKNVLRNMYYVEKISRKIVKSVPTLSNWFFTIDGFQKLWKIMNEKFDFKTLKTRFCNQDPLENFFGQIRSHAVRHTNPTPRQFEDSFITLLVSNMKSISIIGGNCEITGDGFLLFSLEEYLKNDVSNIEVHDVCNDDYYDEQFDLITDKIVADESIVALLLQYPQEIIKSILKKVNYCSECQDSFKNSEFLICIRQVICSINKLLKTRAHQRDILKIILQHFKNWNINMNWHECIEHHVDIFNIIVHVIAVKTIVCWCEKKNALINNNNIDNNLQYDMVKDMFELKRMRECYKNEKCKRKENLGKFRNYIRQRI